MNKQEFDLVDENFQSISKGLKILFNVLSSQRMITDNEFIRICSFIRDLKFFANEFEFLLQVTPSSNDFLFVKSKMKKNLESLLNSCKKKDK